ncbi:MAG: hypothetical protein K0Q49_1387 [Haloplasmataceae bacterium]|jgi:putative Mn2+ efflux pump MntP|nr:hypothetical protein [Haloplasmataceae bacterium]
MFSLIFGITIGLALSIDAFMLSLVFGSTFKRKLESIFTSFIVGFFHFFMPILGYYLTTLVFTKINLTYYLESKLNFIAFLILIILGIMMIIKKEDGEVFNKRNLFNKLLFAFSVSVDSFLTGIALKTMQNINIIFVAIIFAFVSCTLTFIGLSIGKKTAEKLLHLRLDFYAGIIMIILAIITLFL